MMQTLTVEPNDPVLQKSLLIMLYSISADLNTVLRLTVSEGASQETDQKIEKSKVTIFEPIYVKHTRVGFVTKREWKLAYFFEGPEHLLKEIPKSTMDSPIWVCAYARQNYNIRELKEEFKDEESR